MHQLIFPQQIAKTAKHSFKYLTFCVKALPFVYSTEQLAELRPEAGGCPFLSQILLAYSELLSQNCSSRSMKKEGDFTKAIRNSHQSQSRFPSDSLKCHQWPIFFYIIPLLRREIFLQALEFVNSSSSFRIFLLTLVELNATRSKCKCGLTLKTLCNILCRTWQEKPVIY